MPEPPSSLECPSPKTSEGKCFLLLGNEEVQRLLQWVAEPKRVQESLEREDAVEILKVFEQGWKVSEKYPKLRVDLADKIALIVGMVRWQGQDMKLLK